jgi:hypothetical protein
MMGPFAKRLSQLIFTLALMSATLLVFERPHVAMSSAIAFNLTTTPPTPTYAVVALPLTGNIESVVASRPASDWAVPNGVVLSLITLLIGGGALASAIVRNWRRR